MFRVFCASLLCACVGSVLLCGCGGGDSAPATIRPIATTPTVTTPTVTTPATPNIAPPRAFGNLQFTLSADKAAYAITDPVNLTFTVKNVGQQPVKFEFNSSKRYDVQVSLDNVLVYQDSADAGLSRRRLHLSASIWRKPRVYQDA